MTRANSFASTRRSFLQCVPAAAAWVLYPRCLRAEGKPRPPLSFTVVSDTHLGYRDQQHAADQWGKTAAEIAQVPGEFVLHLGDVVDGGREEQYPRYLETRKQIGRPVHEIPGNHDPQPLFEKYLRPQCDTAVDHDWLRVLLLNNARVDSHDGFLSDEQLGWIADQCADAARRDMLLAIAMHVPAHANKHPDRGWYVHPESGQTKLYETLAAHQGRILALLHGHFHNGLRGWDDHPPLHEICFPSALYNLDRQLEKQQAPGYNPAEFRPGFTQVHIEGDTLQLRFVAVGEESKLEKALPIQPAAG
ncbi:MAG: metallophosphoesterase [Pirellulales bacterium]